MGKPHELVLTLRRNSPAVPWGFSLVGGSDVKTPLIVTRVAFGSPVDGVLHRGDIISKVGNYDSRDIRHQDAQNLFRNAGNNINVVVQRDNSRHNTSTGSSRSSSHNYSPLSASPSAYSPVQHAGPALTPVYTSALTPIDDNYFEVLEYNPRRRKEDDGDLHVTQQPYRTTPLVLPGAKVKRETGPTECYLRHHPNPAVRAPPHHLDPDHFLRQRVANSVLERISTGDPNRQVVHKQFNSPINLYSQPNIEDTLKRQTGVSPVRRTMKYNPAESETYKAIQEEQQYGSGGEYVQEIRAPPQSKVYVPNKTIPSKKSHLVVNQNPAVPFQVVQKDDESIQQSGSFKRIMWSVLQEN